MSTRDTSAKDDPVIVSRDQLVAPMQAGEKPASAWRIGTEHEKLVYKRVTHHSETALLVRRIRMAMKPKQKIMEDVRFSPAEAGHKWQRESEINLPAVGCFSPNIFIVSILKHLSQPLK